MKSTLKLIIFLALCYLALQNSFQCNVAACQFCSYPNICGLCQPNFILNQNLTSGAFYCTSVTCPSNCKYCYRNNICQSCASGFFITSTGGCSNVQNSSSILPSNCLYGTNNQTCTICAYGYTNQSGYCYTTIQLTADDSNCMVKMTSTICQICSQGYIVNSIGKCVQNMVNQNNCNVPNCAYCTSANTTCAVCFAGFQLTLSNTCSQTACPITNCIQCGSGGSCKTCAFGYVLNFNNTVCSPAGYGCTNIKGCSVCSGPQSCGQCQAGYILLPYTVNNVTLYLCKPQACPFNITNCQSCVPSYNSIFTFNKWVCAPNGCNTNYINLNGYCVPNITGINFACSVPNCQSCSYNNFCSVCSTGYTLTREGNCQKAFCNVLNCQACSLNNICSQCMNGYTLVLGMFSIPSVVNNILNFAQLGLNQCLPNTVTCNIPNCAYCTQNNTCATCAAGYDFSNTTQNTCVAVCNIKGCLQCVQNNQNLCAVCNTNYTLQNGGSSCSAISFSCSSSCNNGSCIYNWVTGNSQCIQCLPSSGITYTLYAGQCYSQPCNITGCSLCSQWTTPVLCLSCQQGYIKMNGYCMIPNCNNTVKNCANCIENGKCIACQVGFNLQNSTNGTVTCTPINSTCVDNCVTCSSTGSCITCASPYIALNGICVCSFQNCLECKQSALACNSCPLPLYASMQQPGCSPLPNLNYNLNCTVNDCQYCLTSSQCAVCAVGYRLTANLSCMINDCANLGLQNCQLCDQWGLQCHLCQTNYTLNNFYQGGSCFPVNNTNNMNYTCNVSGCAVCSATNNSICVACLAGYYPNNGTMITQCTANGCNIPNCYLCLLNNICTTCLPGYYLMGNIGQQSCQPFYNNVVNCQNQIQYCDICVKGLINTNSSTPQQYCIKCQDGFEFDSVNTVCVPQTNTIPNCKIQSNQAFVDSNYNGFFQPECLICEQGYFINNFGLCSPYNPATNSTGCNVYNCLYCAANSTLCSFCLVPWGISMTGQCQTNISNFCPANCQLCANSTLCYTCVSTYLLNSTGACVSCNIMGCTQCQVAGVCSICNQTANYYLVNSTGLCLLCNIPNCANCTGNNVCQTCSGNFTLSSNLGSCLICDKTQPGMANCISCSQTNQCGVCASGYQIYSANNSSSICVTCNVINCLTCNADNVCSVCLTGYSLINGTCQQCTYPCATCVSNGTNLTCASCSTPFYFLNPLSNGTCVVNTIPNCVSYNSTNTSMCTGCNQVGIQYVLNNTENICQLSCPTNCQTCNGTSCTMCINGYFIGPNSTCTPCQVTGCLNCNANSSQCGKCFDGYALQGTQCTMCPSYCATCQYNTNTNQIQCLTLSSSNQQQVLINQGSQTLLAVCQQNCLTCSNVNPLFCITCKPGFYLNSTNGNCMQCGSTCLSCNSTNPSQCLACFPNGFLINNTCFSCNTAAGSNCLTCIGPNNPNNCTSCIEGFYLVSQTCTPGCPQNCLYCTGPSVCTQCASGYALFQSTASNSTSNSSSVLCAPCIQSCRTCAQGQPATCLSCGAGFYLSAGTCIQCTTNCNTCNSAGCLNCVTGFFLNPAGSCSVNCILPCATCSSNNPSKCLTCIAGYSLNSASSTCNQSPTCNGACTACPLGYTIQLGKCLQCTVNNCQSCLATSLGICTSCVPGFYLNSASNQCLPCQSSCSTCLSASGCTTCAIGYTTIQNIPMGPNGFQCVACTSPCATCIYSPNQCTSCISGYQFSGWKCTQSFYFGFTIKLNTNFTVFNQNYMKFLTALTNAINGVNSNAITISSIILGSVVVAGQAAPTGASGTQTSNQQYSSLDSSLAANNQLAGMQIISSTVTVVGGSIDYSTVNLALILGICIPVGVLIIAGIILYVYCKRKRSAQNIIQRIKQDSGLNVRQSFQLSANYKDTTRPFQQSTSIN